MRRALTIFLILCFSLSLCTTAFAANSEDQDVYAKYIGANIEKESAPVEDGKANVELPDGTEVEAENIPTSAVRMEIVPIPKSEQEAYAWFAKCLESIGTPISAYDIYFLDAEGDRINANGVTVTIDCPSYEGELIACSVSTNETTKTLTSTIEDGKITFTTDSGNHYVLSEKKAAGTTDPGTTPDDPVSPPTGDDTMIWPWILVAIVVLSLIFFLIIWKRRKKDEEQKQINNQ